MVEAAPTQCKTAVMKRLGLLACDSLWEPLRSGFGDYPEMFTALFAALGAELTLEVFPVYHGTLPATVSACDGWLISGSRAGVYEDLPWIAPLMDFARAAHAVGVPQVGVCFGHQLLAQALGGRTEKAPHGWGLGNVRLELLARPDWLAPLPPSPWLHMAHQDQVTRLPARALHLATSAHCHYAMFALDERVLALQPHPEFTSAFMRALTDDPGFHVASALRTAALASYARPADSLAMARVMADFLSLLPGAPR